MRFRNLKLAAAVLAGASALVAGVSGGAANAYPPGSKMFVSVSPRPVPNRAYVGATASNVMPGCTVVFQIPSYPTKSAVAGHAGHASVRYWSNANARDLTVKATSTKCASHEVATTRYFLAGYAIKLSHTPRANRPFLFEGIRFVPGSNVTLTARKGHHTISHTVRVNRNGWGVHSFTLSRGTWLLVAASRGHAATRVVTVR